MDFGGTRWGEVGLCSPHHQPIHQGRWCWSSRCCVLCYVTKKNMEIYRLWKDPKHISSYIVTLHLQSILSKYGIHINFVKIQKPDVGHNFVCSRHCWPCCVFDKLVTLVLWPFFFWANRPGQGRTLWRTGGRKRRDSGSLETRFLEMLRREIEVFWVNMS
jgi:hypothetical protein